MLQGASVESHVPMYEHRKVVFFYQNYPLYSDFIYYLMLFELFFCHFEIFLCNLRMAVLCISISMCICVLMYFNGTHLENAILIIFLQMNIG